MFDRLTVIYLSASPLYLHEQRFVHKRSLHRGIPLMYNVCTNTFSLNAAELVKQ